MPSSCTHRYVFCVDIDERSGRPSAALATDFRAIANYLPCSYN